MDCASPFETRQRTEHRSVTARKRCRGGRWYRVVTRRGPGPRFVVWELVEAPNRPLAHYLRGRGGRSLWNLEPRIWTLRGSRLFRIEPRPRGRFVRKWVRVLRVPSRCFGYVPLGHVAFRRGCRDCDGSTGAKASESVRWKWLQLGSKTPAYPVDPYETCTLWDGVKWGLILRARVPTNRNRARSMASLDGPRGVEPVQLSVMDMKVRVRGTA